eukprot:3809873-Amphidinium_carterae.1
MSAVTSFGINANSFEGALPGSGLQVMRSVSKFYIFTNSFKGALPDEGMGTMTAMAFFCIQNNGLTCEAPRQLEPSKSPKK